MYVLVAILSPQNKKAQFPTTSLRLSQLTWQQVTRGSIPRVPFRFLMYTTVTQTCCRRSRPLMRIQLELLINGLGGLFEERRLTHHSKSSSDNPGS